MNKLVLGLISGILFFSANFSIAGGGGCEYMGPDIVGVSNGAYCQGPEFEMKFMGSKNEYVYLVQMTLDYRSWTEEVQVDYGGANCLHEDVWIVPTSSSNQINHSSFSIYGNGTSGANYSMVINGRLVFEQSIECFGLAKPGKSALAR
jgi:hypothetical protein